MESANYYIRLVITIMVMVRCVSDDEISRLLHRSGRWHSKCQSRTGDQPRKGEEKKQIRTSLDFYQTHLNYFRDVLWWGMFQNHSLFMFWFAFLQHFLHQMYIHTYVTTLRKVGPGCLQHKIILDPSLVAGVYQLSIAPSKHFQFFSGCGPGCGGGGCGEQKTWPISTKQSGGVYSVFIWIILFLWRFVMLKRGQ